MNKLIFILVLLLGSCAPPNQSTQSQDNSDDSESSLIDLKIPYKDTPRGICVVNIDSCEYIYCEVRNGGVAITHKQNCNNPIHLEQK